MSPGEPLVVEMSDLRFGMPPTTSEGGNAIVSKDLSSGHVLHIPFGALC
jgi:hypothetical protein